MKQNMPPAPLTTTPPTESVFNFNNILMPPQSRASSKSTEPPKTTPDVVNGMIPISSRSGKPLTIDLKKNSRAKRGLVTNKAKHSEEVFVSHDGMAKRGVGDSVMKGNGDDHDGKKELLEKLVVSESLIKNLQSELRALKAELDKAKSLNVDLESHNRKLTLDLAAAEAKVVNVAGNQKEPIGEHQSPKFKQIQKLIADKLERSKVKKDIPTDGCFVKPPILATKANVVIPNAAITTMTGRTSISNPCIPPPPPPPMPQAIASRPPAKVSNTKKAPQLVKLFHSLKNQEGMKDTKGVEKQQKPVDVNVHSSIVGEIQNRSAHLLAVRADIETKGEFIHDLIKKVVEAAFMDIEDVLNFVNWLDGQLSSLADEHAVLKHFNWPERKADAMREAAMEYRELKFLEQEISSFKDDTQVPCGASLRKMTSLLDKSEHSIQRLVRLRNSVMHSYQEYKIPTAWMLDSGTVTKIKQACMTLVKICLKRVTREVGSVRKSDKHSSQESLLRQALHFVYRVHQFAGGLDAESLCVFEGMRQRVQGSLAGSRELLGGIDSTREVSL